MLALLLSLSLSVTPVKAFAPADLTIKVRSEAERGILTIWTDDATFYRKTEYPINPKQKVVIFTWRRVPLGWHRIYLSDGKTIKWVDVEIVE